MRKRFFGSRFEKPVMVYMFLVLFFISYVLFKLYHVVFFFNYVVFFVMFVVMSSFKGFLCLGCILG